jgi:hypothetical protein
MNARAQWLDGNALGGLLHELFGAEQPLRRLRRSRAVHALGGDQCAPRPDAEHGGQLGGALLEAPSRAP